MKVECSIFMIQFQEAHRKKIKHCAKIFICWPAIFYSYTLEANLPIFTAKPTVVNSQDAVDQGFQVGGTREMLSSLPQLKICGRA